MSKEEKQNSYESDRSSDKPIKNQNLSKKIAKGSVFFGIAGTIEQLVTFSILTIYSHLLSYNDYGFYSKINARYLFLASLLFISAVRNIVIKHISRNMHDKKYINAVLSGQFLFSLMGSIIFIMIFFLCFEFKLYFPQAMLFPLFIISFTITESLSEINMLFIALQEYKLFNITKLFKCLLLFIFSISFFLFFKFYTTIPPYYGLMIGSIIQNFGSLAFNYYLIKKHYGSFLTRHLKFKQIFIESLRLGINNFLSGSIYQLDIIILGSYYADQELSNKTVANFTIVQKTGINASKVIGLLLGNMMISILSPLISNKNYKTAEKVSGKILKLLFYILSIIMLVIAVVPKVVIEILYGSQYYGMSNLLYISFFIIYFSIVYSVLDALFVAINKIRFLYIINTIKTILFIIIAYMFGSKYGRDGMLFSIAISLAISFLVSLIVSSKGAKFNLIKYVYKILILGTIVLGSTVFISNFYLLIFWQKIILFSIMFVLYNALIIFMGIITTDDLNIVKKIFKDSRFEKWVNKGLCIVEKLPIHEENIIKNES